jgi:lipopolysaccharide exporter
LTSFSVWTWMWNMVGVGRERTQTFIIGRLLGTAPLGVFVVAQDFGAMPSTELVLPMGRAMYSALAMTRRDGGDGEAIWLRIVGIIAIIAFPAAIGFALVAEPVVLLVLGPQWSAAVPLLQLISVSYALSLFTECCHVQFDSYGLVALDFRAMLATSALRILAALIFIPRYGLLGAAAGLLISMMIEQVVYLSIKKFVLPFSWLALLRQIWRPTLAAAGMAAVVLGTGLAHLPPAADNGVAAARLISAVCLGTAIYPALVLLFWLAAGRPDGVETDALGKLRESLHRLRSHVTAPRDIISG